MRPEPKLEFAFEMKLEFADRLRFGPVPAGGLIGFVSISGGIASGPKLNARAIAHSGGDWARMRTDGVVEFNAHYLLETDDGTTIYVQNQGYGRAAPELLKRGEEYHPSETAEHYFRVTPKFQTPIGPYDWMTKAVFLGVGERRQNPDHTVFHYYVVL